MCTKVKVIQVFSNLKDATQARLTCQNPVAIVEPVKEDEGCLLIATRGLGQSLLRFDDISEFGFTDAGSIILKADMTINEAMNRIRQASQIGCNA